MLVTVGLALALSGCASFHAVETTPEGITGSIEPGDTVRVTTREHGEFRMLVTAINDYQIAGRVNGNGNELRRLPFDRIEIIEIQQLSMKKALLTVVLPVVVAAIVACNNGNCRTRGVLNGRL